MTSKTFAVAGLTCLDCAERVKAAVDQVDVVDECQVDLASGTLTVSLVSLDAPVDGIVEAVRSTGYILLTERRQQDGGVVGFVRFVFSKIQTVLTVIAGALTLLGLLLSVAGASEWLWVAIFAGAIIVGGIPVARSAWQELWRSRSLGINSLMVIAVVGAAFIGEWAEGAIVVVLFALGEALEGYAADQARGALESLLELAPSMALRVSVSGETESVRIEELAIGDLILVRPGDRIGVDGIVRSGQSAVDQAAITGESIPVERGPGDGVYAGTISTTGALEVEVSQTAANSTLSRMVALVREAQSRQAPVQRFIDSFARVYTPIVAIVALLVALVPPLVFGQPLLGDRGWLMRALQMLVIACPCALVISTPVSLVSAMTNAASRGVLIKGGSALEALSRVRVFAFDKTGTLTEGRPVVTDVIDVCGCGECTDDCGLRHAAALELQSTHPLAQALLDEAEIRQLAVSKAQDVNVLSGRGVEGTVDGARVTVASHAHFDQHVPHPDDICQMAEELAAEGKTVILVEHDNEVCSVFGVADVPRTSSKGIISTLRSAGYHTIMLSGDHQAVADEIGRQIGLDEVRGDLLPEDKMDAIAALAKDHGAVAMIGDGVNDAPALARADVGIAMGGAGSAQAMETAEVVLMGDDLTQLPFVVRLSRRVKRVVGVNIAFSLGVKAAVFALAGAGLATLWMAIVADVGASLAVIVNGLRLRRVS